MRVIAEVLNSSGVKQGDGPILNVTSVSYKRMLDGVGQATVTVPAADPRAIDLLAIKGRMTIKRPLATGVLNSMFTESIIVQMNKSVGESGHEITLNLVDKISLLEDVNTGIGRKFKGVTLDSAMTTLLALSSAGFTHSFVDAGLSTLVVSMRFDGVSVLDAIKEILAKHGLHWYAVGSTLYITSGGSLASGVLYNMINVPSAVAGMASHAFIQDIKHTVDADKLVTKIIPQGKGDGDTALSLKKSTRSSPYTIQSETGPNSKLQYYISDSAAVTAYGTITKIVKFDNITPVDKTSADKVTAANQLYDAAVAELERYKQPVNRYNVQIRSPNTAYGSFGVPRPSEKRRVVYKGYVTPVGQSETTYIDLDDELWVIGVTETINQEGYTAAVELADQDVPAQSTAGKIVNDIKALKAGARTPKAVSSVRVLRGAAQNIPTSTLTTVTFTAVIHDTDDMWSASTPGRLTAPEDGIYLITGGVVMTQHATGMRGLYVYWNNVDSICIDIRASVNATFQELNVGATTWQMSAGDYVELRVYQDSGATLQVLAANRSYFSLTKIG